MKGKAYGKNGRMSNGIICRDGILKKDSGVQNRLKIMPYVVLRELVLYLYGFDALAFAECAPFMVMDLERQFWRCLGT